ncbi:MAG: hypothetical protein LKF36_00385 [Lactobacillus sp.]|nr:hypothetical protein [Lactobacillus sp.]
MDQDVKQQMEAIEKKIIEERNSKSYSFNTDNVEQLVTVAQDTWVKSIGKQAKFI